MKILFIHNSYQQMGGEDVALQLEVDILREYGHKVEVIHFNNNTIINWHQKIIVGITSLYNPTSYKIILDKIDSFKPSIIHVHNLFFQASPSVLFAAKKKNIPIVMTLHNYRLICANALLLKNNHPCVQCIQHKFPIAGIKNACYRNSAIESGLITAITGTYKLAGVWKKYIAKYIVLTEFSKKLFNQAQLGFKASQIVIKPNYVKDLGSGLANRDDFYLFAGRLTAEKGVSPLLEAFAAMPQVQLALAGDGPLKEVLSEQFKEHKNIHFLGKQTRNELVELMKKTKALIFPSLWYEGLPYTIIEALSTGTPVLCSRLGAMEEMIEDGYNGLLFLPNSAEQIIETVNKFNNSKETDLYKNARKTYLEKYHPDIHYKNIMNIYQSLLKQ